MIRRVVLLAALALPASAQASTPEWQLTPMGDPLLLRTSDRPGTDPAWWTCPPADACRWVTSGERLEPGLSVRGTIFESQSNVRGQPDVRSPMWLGRVGAAVVPALEGAAVPGKSVRPVAAGWTGGWGDEHSVTVVLACPTPSRTDCEYLTNAGGQTAWGDRQVLPQHLGRYLYAVEYRFARSVPAPVLPAPGPVTRPAPSALVAVSPPAGPVAAEPPSASVTLRTRALRVGKQVTVGKVSCSARCSVEVTAGTARRTFSVRGSQRLTLAVPRSGRPMVRVSVDGLRLASARVRL